LRLFAGQLPARFVFVRGIIQLVDLRDGIDGRIVDRSGKALGSTISPSAPMAEGWVARREPDPGLESRNHEGDLPSWDWI